MKNYWRSFMILIPNKRKMSTVYDNYQENIDDFLEEEYYDDGFVDYWMDIMYEDDDYNYY